MFAKNRFDFIVPGVVLVVFTVLAAVGATARIEQRVYDLFLHVKPAVAENPSILLLDVDDLAISKVGVWPWSRDGHGRSSSTCFGLVFNAGMEKVVLA